MTTPSSEWMLRCTTCGREGPLAGRGLRIGAASIGKRVLGYCRGCERLRWVAVERGPSKAADGAWLEVLSYVSERSIDAETGERILKSSASESRKREVAAHLAEGALTAEEALRLLDA